MDIDVTEIDVNAAQAGKPVTCYYCNNEGHMKKDCHKFKATQEKGENESPGAGTTTTTFGNNKTRGEARRASPCYRYLRRVTVNSRRRAKSR